MAKRRRVGAVLIPVEVSVRSLKREGCNTIGVVNAALDGDCEHSSPPRKRGVEMREGMKGLRVWNWEAWIWSQVRHTMNRYVEEVGN
jgi:hypothetical protein